MNEIISKILPLCVLFVITIAAVPPVFADADNTASLKVAVRQVNPDGAAQTVTCTLLQKACSLSLVINAGTAAQQSLNVQVLYYKGGVSLNFQTTGGYFYSSSMIGKDVLYHTVWNAPLQGSVSSYTVTLFQPLSPNLIGPGTTSTDAHTPVANLEVTATPAP